MLDLTKKGRNPISQIAARQSTFLGILLPKLILQKYAISLDPINELL